HFQNEEFDGFPGKRTERLSATLSSSVLNHANDLVVSQLDIKFSQFVSNFVQRRHTEVLGGKQLVGSSGNQLPDSCNPQSSHTLTTSNREIQVGNRHRQLGLIFRRKIAGIEDRFALFLMLELPKRQVMLPHQF